MAATEAKAAGFGKTLTTRVNERLTEDDMRWGRRRLHRKAVVVVGWYALSYVALLLAGSWFTGVLACLSMALAMVSVGFNIQHDANHNAFFDTGGRRRLTRANRIAGLSLNAIGGSSKRWIDGHVHLHHSAPNVVGTDYDIVVPFARMAPQQESRPYHAYQHVYVWFLYGFTALGIVVGDIVNAVQEAFAGGRKGKAPSARDQAGMAVSKGLFLAVMVGVPLLFHPGWIVLLGSLFVMFVAGFLLGIVFQLAHVVEETEFCEADNRPDVRWHEWQVRSSVDFCHGSGPADRALTWFIGGLNYQTEHHLLPNLPHTLYPVVAPVVEDTCAEYDIPYHVQPSLRAAVRSHHRHLRNMGRQ